MSSNAEDERRAATASTSRSDALLGDNKDLPAIFWDAMPTPDELENNSDYAAIQELLKESTPEERAANYKDTGNKKLQVADKYRRAMFYKEAIEFYTRGIDVKCGDAKLNCVLYSNRAHAQSILQNWRHALKDAQMAIACDASHIKSYFRAARAAFKLNEYETCAAICQAGAAVERTDELENIARENAAAQTAAEARRKRDEEERAKRTAPGRLLAKELLNRGYQVGRPQFSTAVGNEHRRPSLVKEVDGSYSISWPMILFYPEVMGNDVIEAASEHDTLSDHLDAVFAHDAPPLEWDEERKYTRDNVEAYYLCHATKPLVGMQLAEAMNGQWPTGLVDDAPQRYGPRATKWILAPQRATLKELMTRPDHVVPGVPVFFIVARGTQFRDRFLAEEIQRY